MSTYSYLLFHTLAELICIVIACGVFMLAYNSRRILDNNYLLFLGIAYLFIGLLDLVHALAYKGMEIFHFQDANCGTQLWIAARYMESLTLLAAPLFLRHSLKVRYVFLAYGTITLLILVSILSWPVFPTCYDPVTGLTGFKIVSEYVICGLLASAIVHLYRKRSDVDPRVFRIVVASMVLTILSEVNFTLYSTPYGFANLIGHLVKILSFYLIYKAIIETGLMRPYDLLFRNLKRSEQQLLGARDQLLELNRLKDRFLRIAAHDLRNPISIVQGYLRFLEVPDRQSEMKATIDKACRNMLAIIDDLLDLNAIQSGQLKLERVPTFLGGFLRDLEESYVLLAGSKSIAFKIELGPDLPRVEMDPLRIGQVINNLVTNAIHYSAPGTTITLRAHQNSHGEVKVEVIDEGVGIRPEEMDALFQEFSKTSSRPTSGEKSTGLGLAIVKRLVEAHGGRVGVESTPGKGSTFWFVLPALVPLKPETTKDAVGAVANPPARGQLQRESA